MRRRGRRRRRRRAEALETAAADLARDAPRAALRALEPVEQAEPDNPWLWFYRARAHHQLGDYYACLHACAKTAALLADLGDPDPELAESVHRLRVGARREIATLSLRAGVAYDSNVSYLGGGATGPGLIAGRGDGLFGSSATLNVAPIADGLQRLDVAARVDNSWHFAIEQFDVGDYGGSLRYRRKIGDAAETSIAYDYDLSYLGYDPFLSNHAVTPALSWHWRGGPDDRFRLDQTTLFYQFEARDFRFPASARFNRDGPSHEVGVEQRAQLRPVRGSPWEWKCSAGYSYEAVFTRGTEFDARYHNFHLGLEVPLVRPWIADRTVYLLLPDRELKFTYGATWQIGDYREVSVLDRDRDKRCDYIVAHAFALSLTVFDDPDCGKLVLHAIIHWTDANSNVTTADRFPTARHFSPFTYDKSVYGFQLEWTW